MSGKSNTQNIRIGNRLIRWLIAESRRQATDPMGSVTTYAYDPRQRLQRLLTVSHPSTANQQLVDLAYTFDAASYINGTSLFVDGGLMHSSPGL